MTNEERQTTMAKQVIIIRKDLNMPSGKFGAMCAHASMGALFKCGIKTDVLLEIKLQRDSAVEQWVNGNFTKIILSVKSEEQLLNYFKKIETLGVPCSLITDAGHTVFNGVKTHVGIGVGPVFPHEIDDITKRLRLY